MTRIAAPFFILIALASASAHAIDSPQTREEGFAPIAFMAGSCWEGPIPTFVADSLGSGPVNVVHCVEWRIKGTVLTDTLTIPAVDPNAAGETHYWWGPEAKTVRYIYWGSGGQVSTGTMKSDGPVMIFDDERVTGGSRGPIQFVTTWTPDETSPPQSFTQVRRRQNADGVWTDTATSVFKRQPLE